MYGTRDTPAARERERTKTLNSVGFESGVSNPALLHSEKMDAFMMAHGDDFITVGDDEALSEVEHVMSSHYTIKVQAILGAGRDDAKEMRILNRYVRWNSDGERSWIEYEPDPRHAELMVKSLNLESAKGVTTPSVKKRLGEVLMTSPQLDAMQTRHCRSVVMRAAYLSDRPDLSYSTKELARDMQKPTEQSMTNLSRLGRYLKRRPRLVQLFVEQTSTANVVRLDVYGDSDHAGCLKTRKSTTGMVLMRNAHTLSQSVKSHPARADSLLVGATASARGRPSFEEGAGRHERERCAHQTSGREAHDEPVDNDGLRFHRTAHSIGARSAVTNWRLKSSMSLRRIASCFKMTVKIVFSMTFQQEFWKHAESRSGRGILQRDGRAWLVWWRASGTWDCE